VDTKDHPAGCDRDLLDVAKSPLKYAHVIGHPHGGCPTGRRRFTDSVEQGLALGPRSADYSLEMVLDWEWRRRQDFGAATEGDWTVVCRERPFVKDSLEGDLLEILKRRSEPRARRLHITDEELSVRKG
jgi:hypothetical protein